MPALLDRVVLGRRQVQFFLLLPDKDELAREFGVDRGGLVVEEMHIFTDTGKPVSAKHNILRARLEGKARNTGFLIRLSYKGKFFFMWRVTWMYIIQNNSWRGAKPTAKAKPKAKTKKAA